MNAIIEMQLEGLVGIDAMVTIEHPYGTMKGQLNWDEKADVYYVVHPEAGNVHFKEHTVSYIDVRTIVLK